MKILIITPTIYEFPGRIGGAESYVASLAESLAKNSKVEKVGVLGFSLNTPGNWISEKVHYNIFKSYPLKNNPSNPIPFFNILELRKWDVIYLQQFHTWLTFACILLAKIYRKKIILTDHNGGGATYNRRLKIDRLIDLFLSTSKLSFKEIGLHPKKMSAIYGGVDLNNFHPGNLSKDGLLFVGRAHPIKGILPFLQSCVESDYHGRITLALGVNYDNEDYLKKIRNYLQENNLSNCTVKTNLTRAELSKEYQSHQWTILPSIDETPHESLGLVILESLASDTPVALSPYCGVCELFEDSSYPFVHILRNNTFFLKTISNTEPVGARDWAMKNASWESIGNKVLVEISKIESK